MRRREFLICLGYALVPEKAPAQKALPVVGILNSGPSELRSDQSEPFRRGLKEAGFVDGQNVLIVHRGADDHYDRLAGLAAELVGLQVAVIAAVGGPVVLRPADARAIDAAFAALAEQNITALVVGADAFFNNNRQQIVGLAARYKILAIYPFREYPLDGGLLSYGPNLTEAYREAG